MGTLQLKIHGMDCAEEVAVLKRELAPIVGGEQRLAFDILKGQLTVDLQAPVSFDHLLQSIARTGMRGERWADRASPSNAGFWRQHGRTMTTAGSGVLALAAFVIHAVSVGSVSGALGAEGLGPGHNVPLLARLIYGAAIVTGGWFVAPKAWLALRRWRPDMNLLMTLAVLGAVSIDEWFEAASVSFLFALALTLESWSLARARRAVAALMDLSPSVAHVKNANGRYEDRSPAEVTVGSWVLVRPGEKIPLDGVVRQGRSAVNQAPITGESLHVEKDIGAAVFAGTINGDGALEVESTKPADDTTLAHIIHLVSEAQGRRAPAEQWVERFAHVYTPSVLLVAILTVVVPPLALGQPWAPWLYRSLVLLVIGCPCALVISTPVTIVAALTSAARHGVLIKGGRFVEAPARLRAIALDKTGTLTAGRPAVTEIVALNGHSPEEILRRAVAIEAHSDHPIARAIVAHAIAVGIQPGPVANVQAMQGRGATAEIEGRRYWLGSHQFLEERGLDTREIHERTSQLSQAGQTVVMLADAAHVYGFMAVADPLRPDAAATVRELRDAGIDHIVMLTGDHADTAERIGRKIRVDDVRAELLPADKVRAIENLVATYSSVAMVGDGVNDAPAMARASVGIAMGAAGSDAAVETADIALMSDDLARLPWLIRHSRRALRVIRQNIGLSLAVKALFVTLTFAGRASLWAAIAADMGVSLLVIINALRLLNAGAETADASAVT